MMRNLGIFLSVLALSSCAHLRNSRQADQGNSAPKTTVAGGEKNREATTESNQPAAGGVAPNSDIDREIAESNPVMSEGEDSAEAIPLHIPTEINERVGFWINYFTVRERERTIRFLERGLPLQAHIETILRDNDMPVELFYLAMIESGFVQSAKSHAKAVGVWQFMRGTGKNYGLAVNSLQDERQNWIKSTEAAASYLKDLNNVFGSWYLALAAYNAGEYRIVRSLMRGKTRDFWALAEAGLLPKETLDYVPKFMAALIVGKNLKKYGLEVHPAEAWDNYATVSVPAGVSLQSIARTTDVPLAELQRWNKDLIRGITPVGKSAMVDIYVPQKLVKQIADNNEAIRKLKPVVNARMLARVNSGGEGLAYYVVRSGDTLIGISHNLGVSRRTLMKMNGLRVSRIHAGQRLKYQNNGQRVVERRVASVKARKQHKVKHGENLTAIAKRYKTSVQELVRLNSLKGRELIVGQRLVVR